MTLSEDKLSQPEGSALFESQDTRTASYQGAERRRSHRRIRSDRRLETRFELDKTDRRESPGRRAGEKNAKFW